MKHLQTSLKEAIPSLLSQTGLSPVTHGKPGRTVAHGMSAKKLSETPGRWVVMTRGSLLKDYERKGIVPDTHDAWCWSMWRGYLENEQGSRVRAWLDKAGTLSSHLHTSGHASPVNLLEFAQKMNPKALLPVHGTAWGRATKAFPHIVRLADGQSFVV